MTEPASTLVSLQGIAKVFANGVAALADLDLDIARRRVPVSPRPLRLRKIDGFAPRRGTDRADSRARRLAGIGRCGSSRRDRFRVPGSDADALGQCGGQCMAAAAASRRVPARRAGEHRGEPCARRLERFCESLSARTLRRHEDAGVDRAGAFRQAAPAAHGRALRRPRRDRALPPQRRSAAAAERAATARSCS